MWLAGSDSSRRRRGEEGDGRTTVFGDEQGAILVVDRDAHVRRLLRQFVSGEYVIEFFDDGLSALDRVRERPPRALITELLVPRLDGLALCRLLKGDSATQDVPILILSVLAGDALAEKAGADAFLAKPLERGRLLTSLRGLTERAAARRSGATAQQAAL